MCLSAFVLARGRGGTLLVGRPARHDRWFSEFMPSWNHYDAVDLDATLAGWLLPATYLLEGEDPKDTARRVVREELGARAKELRLVGAYNATAPSSWYPGQSHWDLAFLYEARDLRLAPRPPPWWRELAFRPLRDIRPREFAWSDDLVAAIKRSSAGRAGGAPRGWGTRSTTRTRTRGRGARR